MGFFDQGNTQLEVAWFSVLALLSFFCFPFGIRLSRRFPQIVAAKLVVGLQSKITRYSLSSATAWRSRERKSGDGGKGHSRRALFT